MSTIPLADQVPAVKRAHELYREAGALLKQESPSAEDLERANQLKAEGDQLKMAALKAVEIENAVKELTTAEKGHRNNGQSAEETGDSEEIDDRPIHSNYKKLNTYLRAVIRAGKDQRNISKHLALFRDLAEEADLSPIGPMRGARKTMAESVGASGGFLVPAEFQETLLALQAERGILRSRATIIRMRRRQIQIPVLDQTGTTAGLPHWFGGMRATWTEEAATKTETEATFRLINLVAHKLVCYTRVSDELLDDAVISLSDFLMGPMGFPGVIAWMEDYAFLRGNGAGQPLGILNSPAAITYNRVDQSGVSYDDALNMLERFLPSARGLWLASQSLLMEMLSMTGPSGNPSYVWGPGPVGQTALGGVPATFLGYPVIFTEKLPRAAASSTGDLILIDPMYYLIGDRQATTLASTIYDRFPSDETSYRAVHRVDGQPWLNTPITLADGTTQVSPFVLLGPKAT